MFIIEGEPLQMAPAPPGQHSLQVSVSAVADDGAVAGYGAYQVVKLSFDGSQVWKNIRMVIFEIVQVGDLGAVVDKL